MKMKISPYRSPITPLLGNSVTRIDTTSSINLNLILTNTSSTRSIPQFEQTLWSIENPSYEVLTVFILL